MKSTNRPLQAVLVSTMIASSFSFYTLSADEQIDFGKKVEHFLEDKSEKLFGINKGIKNSAPTTFGAFRTIQQTADQQIIAAKGLTVEYLTRNAGNKTDMMAFWPNTENATHLISCVEGSRETISPNKLNPSVQSINLETGVVKTILRGMNRCDGIRTTTWGSILATEESNDGSAYEIINPLQLNNEYVIDRTTGEVSNPENIVKRDALPRVSWEGLTIMNSGVLYNGDELRPGSNGITDSDGGAIFKFIPTNPHLDNSKITTLGDSPFVSGSVYAMQITCKKPGATDSQWGQGCEVGNGNWILVNAQTARADAANNAATGYYRPEDMHSDPLYAGDGIRFCWTNTGRESAFNFGEVMCATDEIPLNESSIVIANRFIEGDLDFNSFDNLAFQPGTGNLYVIEDHPNGDIFACLQDGSDRNIKSDGCIKLFSVVDSSAEPSGFIFNVDGKTAYVSIQHSNDNLMQKFDDYNTDDVLKITGFK